MTTIDRRDWNERIQTVTTPEGRATRMRSLEHLRQAALPFERLMAEEHWRVYQQMLQGAIELQTQNRDRLISNLLSDSCSSFEAMTLTKRMIAECDATIRAWNAAIDLPVQIRQNGEAAAAALEQETSRYASDADAK